VPQLAFAADPLKIGLILPLTGPFASTGRQVEAACRLYIARNGDSVAGRKVELTVKDDTGAPEVTKRIAQEMVVQDHINILAGFGLTPLALATAPVATEAKVPMIIMAAATSIIPTRSPFIVLAGFAFPQVTAPIADWALKKHIQPGVSLVTDYGPASTRRRPLSSASPTAVGPCSSRCARRCRVRITRRSCSAPRTPSRRRCSCSFLPVREPRS
jgi:branched-chain amino acid transport system substrate-binding protein